MNAQVNTPLSTQVNALIVLIRREFWEHRALWMAPAAVAVLYIVACVFLTTIHTPLLAFNGGEGPQLAGGIMAMLSATQLMFTTLLLMVMSVILFYYLGDCLYAERKDRSILFWKSLPVSDTATVFAKLLVAAVVVPVGSVLLGLITSVLAFGILYARFHSLPFIQNMNWGSTGAFLNMNLLLLADVIAMALWYAPFFGYQLIVSAWAKNAVMVWTLLPPLVIILGEKLIFNSWHAAQLLVYRLGSFIVDLSGVQGSGIGLQRNPASGMGDIVGNINMLPLLLRADLWIGVVIAAVLIFGAIRIRRYRDDT